VKTVVIGAGLAGLVAATRLAQEGADVVLATKGLGGLPTSQGTIDVWGYRDGKRVEAPLDAVAAAPAGHPYAAIGVGAVKDGLAWLAEHLPDWLTGDAAANVWLPTAVGALRPTCLCQPGMLAGAGATRVVIVGLARLKDFQAALIAGNLTRTGRVEARAITIDIPARSGEADSSALTYARAADEPGFAAHLAAAIAPSLGSGEAVGLPAILGLHTPGVGRDLADRLGHPVFEIPLPPPSVAGLRLNDALTTLAKAAGVRVILGSPVTGLKAEGDRVRSVTLASAGHDRDLVADVFVLATGGFETGALALDSYGTVTETALGLPVRVPDGDLIGADYWEAQPLFAAGCAVDVSMRVLDAGGAVVHPNLYAIGGVLAGAQRWKEKSGDGIAVGSAMKAVAAIMGGER